MLGSSYKILVNPNKPEEYVGYDFENKWEVIMYMLFTLFAVAIGIQASIGNGVL